MTGPKYAHLGFFSKQYTTMLFILNWKTINAMHLLKSNNQENHFLKIHQKMNYLA